jgi:arylsulfatase A-like enzyme
MSETTVIVFVSDHGELLGHYGMLIKSIDKYPMLYDVGLKVPLIIRAPGAEGGRVVREAVELIDLCPSLLECAGLEVAPEIQGQSLKDSLHGGAAPQREYVFAESGAAKTIRGHQYKLVYYPGQPYGELYDVLEDPLESTNLYEDPSFLSIRDKMVKDLLDRLIYTEAPRHGESKRGPAYWRRLYRLPFEQTPAGGW